MRWETTFRSMTELKYDGGPIALYYNYAEKSLARIDNSYVKIKHISCLSSLYNFLTVCSKQTLFDLSSRLASNDTIDFVLRHRKVGRAKDLSAPRYNSYHCVTIAYSIQYSNKLYRFVA